MGAQSQRGLPRPDAHHRTTTPRTCSHQLHPPLQPRTAPPRPRSCHTRTLRRGARFRRRRPADEDPSTRPPRRTRPRVLRRGMTIALLHPTVQFHRGSRICWRREPPDSLSPCAAPRMPRPRSDPKRHLLAIDRLTSQLVPTEVLLAEQRDTLAGGQHDVAQVLFEAETPPSCLVARRASEARDGLGRDRDHPPGRSHRPWSAPSRTRR
jgi:hypothetical protein